MELLKQGGRLGDILEAGQWRSPGFLQYMLRAAIDEADFAFRSAEMRLISRIFGGAGDWAQICVRFADALGA